MIMEHGLLPVIPGREEDFKASMKQALPIINVAPGCHGAEVRQGVENPSEFLLLVKWDSIDAHMAYRASDAFEQWRTLTHPFYTGKAGVDFFITHFEEPLQP